MKKHLSITSAIILCLIVAAAGDSTYPQTSTTNFSITGLPAGTTSDLTLTANVQVATSDIGANGIIHVAANVGGTGSWFFKSANGVWTAWTGGSFPAPYYSGPLGSHTISIVDHVNLSNYAGTEIYVGYGLSQADMMNNAKYANVYTVPPLSLLDAINFTGTYPIPGLVNYTNKSGQSLTAFAYPGQVFLSVSPGQMGLAAATQLVQANGGTLIARIPSAGLYWVQVGAGREAAFINVVKSNPAVIYVAPNVPVAAAQTSTTVDLSGTSSLVPLIPSDNSGMCLIAQFDFFRMPPDALPASSVCGLSHGEVVNQFLQQGGQCARTYEVSKADQIDQTAGPTLSFGMLRAAEGALQRGQKLIINLSLQASGQPNDGRDRSVCESNPTNSLCFGVDGRNYASWKSDEFEFLFEVASTLNNMRDDLRNNTVLVVSAGNSGFDLTNEIALLKLLLPRAFSNMLIIGSTGTDGQRFPGFNHDDLLYAPGVNVPAPMTAGCYPSGTSFSAPEVANLVAQLAQLFPDLTAARLVAAIKNAAPRVNGFLTMPTLTQFSNITVNPTSLLFSTTEGGPNPAAQSLTITNTGATGSTLNYWISVSSPNIATTPSSASLTAGASQSVTVSVNSQGLRAGNYTGTITIADPAATNRSVDVRVSLTVQPGVTVLDHTMTNVRPSTCPTAPPRVYTFQTTDSVANVWVYIAGVRPGDSIQWEWHKPSGAVYLTDITNISVTGNYCLWDTMYIAGYTPSVTSGNWSIRVLYNGRLIVTENFAISAPARGQCTGAWDAPNACGPCNTDADCGPNLCWTGNRPAPFCGQ